MLFTRFFQLVKFYFIFFFFWFRRLKVSLSFQKCLFNTFAGFCQCFPSSAVSQPGPFHPWRRFHVNIERVVKNVNIKRRIKNVENSRRRSVADRRRRHRVDVLHFRRQSRDRGGDENHRKQHSHLRHRNASWTRTFEGKQILKNKNKMWFPLIFVSQFLSARQINDLLRYWNLLNYNISVLYIFLFV